MIAPSPPAAFTGYLIRRAQQAHLAAWVREVSPDVSGPQFGILSLLHHSPGMSQREICQEMDMDRSTVADIVRRLDHRGLLTRERDTADRRRNRLALTARGETEHARIAPHAAAAQDALTAALPETDHAELRRLLRLVIDAHP